MLGNLHFLTSYLKARLIRSERGQGSVEYLGIVLVVGAIMLAVIAAAEAFTDESILESITDGIESAIDSLTD